MVYIPKMKKGLRMFTKNGKELTSFWAEEAKYEEHLDWVRSEISQKDYVSGQEKRNYR